MKKLIVASLIFSLIFSLLIWMLINWIDNYWIAQGTTHRQSFEMLETHILWEIPASIVRYCLLYIQPIAIALSLSSAIFGYFGVKKFNNLMIYISSSLFGLLIGIITLQILAALRTQV